MARLSISTGLIACLALAGLVNHATTCCCGDSLLLELVVESCGCDSHAHDRERLSHHPGPLGAAHTCYKSGSQAFLADPDTQQIAGQSLELPIGVLQVPVDSSASLAALGVFGHQPPAGIPPARATRLGRWLL